MKRRMMLAAKMNDYRSKTLSTTGDRMAGDTRGVVEKRLFVWDACTRSAVAHLITGAA